MLGSDLLESLVPFNTVQMAVGLVVAIPYHERHFKGPSHNLKAPCPENPSGHNSSQEKWGAGDRISTQEVLGI